MALAVLSPLRGDREQSPPGTEELQAALETRKQAKYREIRDAELDFRTGKLSEADYRVLDRTLRAEAIEILKELDALEERPR